MGRGETCIGINIRDLYPVHLTLIDRCPHARFRGPGFLWPGKERKRVASSEEKRYQQSLKRHDRNQSAKSRLKTSIKKVTAAAEAKDTAAAETELRLAASALQKAGRKRVLHPNTASRRVARLSRLVQQSKSVTAPTS